MAHRRLGQSERPLAVQRHGSERRDLRRGAGPGGAHPAVVGAPGGVAGRAAGRPGGAHRLALEADRLRAAGAPGGGRGDDPSPRPPPSRLQAAAAPARPSGRPGVRRLRRRTGPTVVYTFALPTWTYPSLIWVAPVRSSAEGGFIGGGCGLEGAAGGMLIATALDLRITPGGRFRRDPLQGRCRRRGGLVPQLRGVRVRQ